MMDQVSMPLAIKKETINRLQFPPEAVIEDEVIQATLRRKLERATALGNLMRNKTRIIFEDSEGIKCVETTIWATTPNSIILKHGMIIPIRRIHNVQFF